MRRLGKKKTPRPIFPREPLHGWIISLFVFFFCLPLLCLLLSAPLLPLSFCLYCGGGHGSCDQRNLFLFALPPGPRLANR